MATIPYASRESTADEFAGMFDTGAPQHITGLSLRGQA
jgi:hypothetical protein